MTIRLARFQPSLKGEQRPKGFQVEPGSEDLLLVLERYQPSDDEKAIQNNWTVVSQVEDGKVVAEENYRETRFEFYSEGCGNEFIILGLDFPPTGAFDSISSLFQARSGIALNPASQPKPSRSSAKSGANPGRFALNPVSQPKSITFFTERMTLESGITSVVPETRHGIYKFEGNRLTIAFRKGDTPPEKFESKPGMGVTLLVLERSKPAASPKPDEPASGKSRTSSGEAKGQATIDGKADKQSVLSSLREQAVRRAKATCHGQANYAQLDKVWRIGMESKFNTKPLTIDVRGKVYFDEDNFCLDTEEQRKSHRPRSLKEEDRMKPSTVDRNDPKRHKSY